MLMLLQVPQIDHTSPQLVRKNWYLQLIIALGQSKYQYLGSVQLKESGIQNLETANIQ